ncbi:MAG: hypothetical protein WCJ21_03890 [Planctomycetota bacterium]
MPKIDHTATNQAIRARAPAISASVAEGRNGTATSCVSVAAGPGSHRTSHSCRAGSLIPVAGRLVAAGVLTAASVFPANRSS